MPVCLGSRRRPIGSARTCKAESSWQNNNRIATRPSSITNTIKWSKNMARNTSNRQIRRGVLVPLVALMLVFLLGMVAFAIDIGYTALVTTQLQATADAAALAAARDLSSHQAATNWAQQFANLN